MKNVIIAVSIALATTLAAGCKKKEDAGKGAAPAAAAAGKSIGSCDQRAQTMGQPVCSEHTGSFWAGKPAEAQARCVAPGKWSTDPCPTAGVVASCKTMPGQPMEAIQRFYGDAEKAKKACAAVGGQLL